jgi:hypothetical protein
MIVPFQIPWDPKGIADMNRRLSATRWHDAVISDWSYGRERNFLQQLIGYWRDQYDGAERRSALNRMPHFRATIDGYGLHFLHYRGRDPGAIPLLLMDGWPSSFVEYLHLAVLLGRTLPGLGAARSLRRRLATIRKYGSRLNALRLAVHRCRPC